MSTIKALPLILIAAVAACDRESRSKAPPSSADPGTSNRANANAANPDAAPPPAATDVDPDAIEQALMRAATLHADGKRDEAVVAYDEILRSVPGNVPARNNRGLLRLEMGDFAGAASDFD